MVADWTKYDPVISETLFAYGSGSIPFYLYIPGDADKPTIQLPTTFVSGDPIIQAVQGTAQ